MKKLILLIAFISHCSFAIEPLKYIEGEWLGTYEEDTDLNSTFTIKNGFLSLTKWDCKNNKIELLAFREIESSDSANSSADKYYEITVYVSFNSKSKGCPNNPDIFKFYKTAPIFKSPLKITILKGLCAKYENATMEWSTFTGLYHRTDRDARPLECER